MRHGSNFINMFNSDLGRSQRRKLCLGFHLSLLRVWRRECWRNAPVSGSLPGLLFARWVLPLLSCVAWKSPFLCSNLSWKGTQTTGKKKRIRWMWENYTEAEQVWTTKTAVTPPEMDSNWQISLLFFKKETHVMSSHSILVGYCLQGNNLGHSKKNIHLRPSHCVSHRGCNLSCN